MASVAGREGSPQLAPKNELFDEVLAPVMDPERYRDYRPPKGVLLSRPSGTGNGLIARATAGEAGMNLMSGDELFEKGAPQRLCDRARKVKPVVLLVQRASHLGRPRGFAGIGVVEQGRPRKKERPGY